MNRRKFVAALAASPAAFLALEEKDALGERSSGSSLDILPSIVVNHLGFRPEARKTFIYRNTGSTVPTEFVVREMGFPMKPFEITLPLKRAKGDFGEHLVGDFTQVNREGLYEAVAGGERSVPFFVRKDAWRRTLPKAVGYHRSQRCGIAVPNVHPACHLDDALRRDNGQHVDTTGGWHDAGDVRKWMDVTMMPAIGMMNLVRSLGEGWDLAGSGVKPLLEEVEWGNRYFRKMQDSTGRVWADTAGGVGGGNSDNHWTDNIIGTADDRFVNVEYNSQIQAIFIAVQAMVGQVFRQSDPGYAQQCLEAARRCWRANQQDGGALDLGWWLMAAVEFDRAVGGQNPYRRAVPSIARQLLALQNRNYIGNQSMVRGFWMMDPNDAYPKQTTGKVPYYQTCFSASMPQALLEAATAYPTHADVNLWRDSVRMHLEDYVIPMCKRSVYGIMPLGVFLNPSVPEEFRHLSGDMLYRYFDPVLVDSEWAGGLNSHVLCYAAFLAKAGEFFEDRKYTDMAYRHLEWVMGANPFASCLMSGEGFRNPYPFSVLTGLIPGGIMNGLSGDSHDEPVLSFDCGSDYRTNEYWSPHNAFYEWTLSLLEKNA